jgi:predicted adenylyl cyclase CyaB
MATNLEIKIPCKSFSILKNKLREIKAEYLGELKQEDIYFKSCKGLLKLRVMDTHSELIRYNRDEKNTRWSHYEIIKISDKNSKKLLRSILDVEAMVKKKRQIFLYKNTRIHLDTVNKLGKFIELETIVKTSLNEAQKRFNYLIKTLQLDEKQQLRLSYRDLIINCEK